MREEDLLRRTLLAYLTVWLTAYACFLAYPTVAPRPVAVLGRGFAAWSLRWLYAADTPYNCFPSLHVAHSFVSALACYRVHRKVGIAALLSACVVAVSTLFARQHYVIDIVAGILLACVAYVAFLRDARREAVPELDRRLAPVFAAGVIGLVAIVIAGFWVAYRLSGNACCPS